jgi:excisionase family DNA binding protein
MKSASSNLPRLVGAKEIAMALHCTAKHIYDLAKRGQVPHYRIGASVRFDPIQIAAWLETFKIAA